MLASIFTIDTILSADFGRNAIRRAGHYKHMLQASVSPTHFTQTSTTTGNTSPVPLTTTHSTADGLTTGNTWPAWVYCTRYSDRPSSGPRIRRQRRQRHSSSSDSVADVKRPRTAFSCEQLDCLRREFNVNKYLSEARRQQLSIQLKLTESQIKIWFQNKRAKLKKSQGYRGGLALQLMAQGLYNHSTVCTEHTHID